MIQLNVLLEIIKQYKLTYLERFLTKITYHSYLNKIKNAFENHDKMDSLLTKEIDNYLQNSYCELELLNFIMKNRKKIWFTDIYRTLDKFDKNYEERYMYLEDVFCNLQTAIDMKLDYKFYAPQKKPKYLSEDLIKEYITYLKGFNKDRVGEFLIVEKVLDKDEYLNILKNAKILNIDVCGNEDLFGLFDGGLVVPRINDGISTLINIHEIVHMILLKNTDLIADKEISNGEDLPIFYELLFKESNDFIMDNLHFSKMSLTLFENYQGEPFEEQVKKLKQIKSVRG